MKSVDPENWDAVAKLFGIAPALVREIVYVNDEVASLMHTALYSTDESKKENDALRWRWVRHWTFGQIKKST